VVSSDAASVHPLVTLVYCGLSKTSTQHSLESRKQLLQYFILYSSFICFLKLRFWPCFTLCCSYWFCEYANNNHCKSCICKTYTLKICFSLKHFYCTLVTYKHMWTYTTFPVEQSSGIKFGCGPLT